MRNGSDRRPRRRPTGALRARFHAPLDGRALALSQSVAEDRALLAYDLWGSLAHARMLGAQGIIPTRSARRIEAGLRALGARAARGALPLDPALEDVHLNVETELVRAIGPDGARLHTARSRNDQVAVDLALYLRDALSALGAGSADVARSLLDAARGPSARSVVAGWTHLQPAQTVYWSQILGTHALRFVRDAERFDAIRSGIRESPLGSGALAGTSLPIDRHLTADLLAFDAPTASSLDGVSDRDAAAETVFAATVSDLHAGALSEELVLGSMAGIDRVRLSDAFVTTSSLMPHKRNPDIAELIRAESGASVGRLAGLLGILKGLPIGYQRDLQAIKPILLDSVARSRTILRTLAPMIAHAEFRPDPHRPGGWTASVEVVDALVAKGVPFRRAHERVARFIADEPAGTSGAPGPARWAEQFPELPEFPHTSPARETERRGSFGGSRRAEVNRLLRTVEARLRAVERARLRSDRRIRQARLRLGAADAWGFLSPDPAR